MRTLLRKLPALIVIFIGFTGMIGWILKLTWFVQTFPKLAPQSFNASFCLVLAGLGLLLFGKRKFNWLSILIGFAMVLIASLTISEELFNINLGIDQLVVKSWIMFPLGYANRMPPNAALPIIFSGLIFILVPFCRKNFNALMIEILIFLVFLIGLLGLMGYVFEMDFLYNWYQFACMSIRSAVAFIVLAIGFWYEWSHHPHSKQWYVGKEDKKIILLSSMILLTISLLAGLSGFVSVFKQQKETVVQTFQEVLNAKIFLIENAIAGVFGEIDSILRNPLFYELFKQGNSRSPLFQDFLEMFLDEGFTAVSVYDEHNQLLSTKGQFVINPDMQVKLNSYSGPLLLWKNNWYVQITKVINIGNEKKTIKVERPLAIISESLLKILNIGKTAEIVICSPASQNKANCFPSRLTPHVFTILYTQNKQRLPIFYALSGEKGVVTAYDYRHKQVVAVYSPLGETGLGIELKMDLAEIYAPILQNLPGILVLLISAIVIGIMLLRWAVLPLIRKVIVAEQRVSSINKRLEETQEWYNLAVAGSQVGLWDWQIETDKVLYSDTFKKLLGYADEVWSSDREPFNNLLHPDDYDRVYSLVAEHLEKDIPYRIEYRLKTKLNGYHWFRAEGKAIRDEQGRPIRMSGSIMDITEHKQVEEIKKEFISVVSHELRTPLTSIRGALGLISGGALGDELSGKTKKFLEIAGTNCDRLLVLINDILDIEKIETGKMNFKFQSVDIEKVVKEAIHHHQAYAEKYQVHLKPGRTVSGVKVNADPERLMQILANLISNAIKFSFPDGEVIIDVEKRADNVRVSITDKGEGIPEKFKKRIFQKFSQADTSNTRGKGGSGLGLSISKAMIERMHGSIGFTSEPNVKTTFYIDLPLETLIEAKSPHQFDKTKTRVLVCDDDQDQARYLQVLLEVNGYAADIASTAVEAKNILIKNKYDALLLDLILPDQDGISLIRELRAEQSTQNLPIIVISIVSETGRSLAQGDAIGVLDWLDKPIDLKKLLKSIEKINKNRPHVLPRVLHVEDDVDICRLVKEILGSTADMISVTTLKEAQEILKQQTFDLVILDLILPDGDGAELIPELSRRKLPIVVLSTAELDHQYAKFVSQTMLKSQISAESLLNMIKNSIAKDRL